ncbi:MAG TPA: GNAT family N-acetyltransferase [Acidobacteriaceae bacterium]
MHTRSLIRPLTEADLPVIRAWMRDAPGAPLWSDADFAGLVSPPLADLERFQGKGRQAWVAEEGEGVLTGFAVATVLCIPETSSECELEFVLVAPHAQRRGIGRTLVEGVLDWACGQGAEEIWLEVRQSNAGALRLYERCGFVVAGQRPGYYADPTEDAVLMRCRISYVPCPSPV